MSINGRSIFSNPYQIAQERLRLNSQLYNEDDWKYIAKGNDSSLNLDMYIDSLDKNIDLDKDTFYSNYNLDFGDKESRLSAIFNETYSNKTDLLNYERELLDENGNEVLDSDGNVIMETYKTTEYEYNKSVIKSMNDYKQSQYERELAQERKKSLADFAALGSEFSLGLGTMIYDVVGEIQGLVEGVKSISSGGTFSEGRLKGTLENILNDSYDDFSKSIIDFESQYSHFRDIDGNYTQLGKYLGQTCYTIGQMIPSIVISKCSGLVSSSIKNTKISNIVLKSGNITSKLSFYSGFNNSNIRENYKSLTSNGISVDANQLVTNSYIKSALQLGVEECLSKALGSSMLDSVAFGRKYKTYSKNNSSLSSSGLTRIFKDFGQEGLEEVIQDTSDILVDKFYIDFINSDYANLIKDSYGNDGQLFGIDKYFQAMTDSFIIGGIVSFASNGIKIIQSGAPQILYKLSNGKFSKNTVLNDNNSAINPIAAWEYGLDLQSFLSNFNNVMEILSNDNSKINKRDVADGIYQMYTSYRLISSLYENLGKDRFIMANKFLSFATNEISKGTFDKEQCKSYANQLYNNLVNYDFNFSYKAKISKDDDKIKDEVIKELSDMKLTSPLKTIRRGQEPSINEFVDKDIKKLQEEFDNIVITNDGKQEVVSKYMNSLFVPINKLMAEGYQGILVDVSAKSLVKSVINGQYKGAPIEVATKIYKDINNLSDVSVEEVVNHLLFDINFFRSVLSVSNKDMIQFLNSLISQQKYYVKEKSTEFNKAQISVINKVISDYKACLIDYACNQQLIDVYSLSSLDSSEIEYIKRNRWCKDLYDRVVTGKNLSENDLNVLKNRINALPIQENKKSFLYNDITLSNDIQKRIVAMKTIDNAYEHVFTVLYDGSVYMPENSNANISLNVYLRKNGLTLENLFLVDSLNYEDVKYFDSSNVEINEDNVKKYRYEQFYNSTNRNYRIMLDENGKVQIYFANSGKIAGYNVSPKINSDLSTSGKNVVIPTKTKSSYLTGILNPKLSNATIQYVSITDIINEPKTFLNKETLNEIEIKYNKFGGLTPQNAFLYLRNEFESNYKNLTILLRQDGTYTFAKTDLMDNLITKTFNGNITSDTKISDVINSKYLTGSLKDIKFELVEDSETDSIAEYEAIKNINLKSGTVNVFSNTIKINKSYLSKNKQLKFAISHEFQHAIQLSNLLCAGISDSILTDGTISKTLSKSILNDIKKNVPQLFNGVKDIQSQFKIANDFIYYCSGETEAYGLSGQTVLDFYPVRISQNLNDGVSITMPWGSKFDIINLKNGIDNTVSLFSQLTKKDFNNGVRLNSLDKEFLSIISDLYGSERVVKYVKFILNNPSYDYVSICYNNIIDKDFSKDLVFENLVNFGKLVKSFNEEQAKNYSDVITKLSTYKLYIDDLDLKNVYEDLSPELYEESVKIVKNALSSLFEKFSIFGKTYYELSNYLNNFSNLLKSNKSIDLNYVKSGKEFISTSLGIQENDVNSNNVGMVIGKSNLSISLNNYIKFLYANYDYDSVINILKSFMILYKTPKSDLSKINSYVKALEFNTSENIISSLVFDYFNNINNGDYSKFDVNESKYYLDVKYENDYELNKQYGLNDAIGVIDNFKNVLVSINSKSYLKDKLKLKLNLINNLENLLKTINDFSPVKFTFVFDAFEEYAGRFNLSNQVITINLPKIQYLSDTLIHELLHNCTSMFIKIFDNNKITDIIDYKNKNFKKLNDVFNDLKAIYNYTIDVSNILDIKEYGFKNEHEFIAECLSNSFIVSLSKIRNVNEVIKNLIIKYNKLSDKDFNKLDSDIYEILSLNDEFYFALNNVVSSMLITENAVLNDIKSLNNGIITDSINYANDKLKNYTAINIKSDKFKDDYISKQSLTKNAKGNKVKLNDVDNSDKQKVKDKIKKFENDGWSNISVYRNSDTEGKWKYKLVGTKNNSTRLIPNSQIYYSNVRGYVNKSTWESTNLKYFNQKQIPEDTQKFIINSDKTIDSKLWNAVKNGRLTKGFVIRYLRNSDNIDDKTFKLINDCFYKNEYIQDFETLKKFVNSTDMYYSLYNVIQKNKSDIPALSSALEIELTTPQTINSIRDTIIKSNKMFSEYKSITNMFNNLNVNEKYLRDVWMRKFDGSLKEASAPGNFAKFVVENNYRFTDDIKISDVVNKDGESLIENISSENYIRSLFEDDANALGYYNDTVSEQVEMMTYLVECNVYYEALKEYKSNKKLDFNKIKSVFENSYKTLSDLFLQQTNKSDKQIVETYNKYLTQFKPEILDRLKSIYGPMISELDPNKDYHVIHYDNSKDNDELSSVNVTRFNKDVETPDKIMNSVYQKIYKAEKLIDGKWMIKRVIKDYGDIVEIDGKIKQSSYKNENKNGKFTNLKSVDEIKDFDKRVSSLISDLKSGKYLTKKEIEKMSSINEKILKIKKQNDEIRKLEKQKKYLKDKSKEKNKSIESLKVIKFNFENKTFELKTEKNMPEKLKELVSYNFKKKVDDEVQFLSKIQDGDSEVTSKHWKLQLKNFVKDNAEILTKLSQDDINDIADFYLNSSIINNGDNSRVYAVIEIYMLTYILSQYRQGNIYLDSDKVKSLENLDRTIVSTSATVLDAWRNALNLLNPAKYLVQQIAKSVDIEFEEKYVDELMLAAKSNNVKLMEKAKEKMYQDALSKVKSTKKNAFYKLLEFEKACMLSSPGTWIRNIVSNSVLGGYVDSSGKSKIPGLNVSSESVGKSISNLINKLLPNKYKVSREKILYSNENKQYKIVGTKVSSETAKWIKDEIIDSGLLNLIEDGISKYDVRKIKGDDEVNDIVKSIANSIKSQIFSQGTKIGKVKIDNDSEYEVYNKNTKKMEIKKYKDMPTYQKAQVVEEHSVGAFNKFIYKMLSDNMYVKRDFIRYLGKMLTEDEVNLKTLSSTGNKSAKYIVDAYTMAAYNYMHKGNVISDFDRLLRKKLHPGAYFMYKQLAMFLPSSWNWFLEGLNYSPIGLISSIKNYAKLENYINKLENLSQKGEKVESARFANYIATRNLGKGVIGTVGWIIGAILAGFGVARIDEEDDEWKLYVNNVGVDISDIIGSQGIMLGIVTVGSIVSENRTFTSVLNEILDQMFVDSVISDLYNTFRYSNSVGEYLSYMPYQITTSFIPNAIKSLSAFNIYKVNYSSNEFVKFFEKVLVQAIPQSAYALPSYVDPYTGEKQVQYNSSILTNVWNKFGPLDIYPYNVSDLEKEAISLGINKSQLTGSYKVNGDSVNLTKEQIEMLNAFYGKLNNKDLKELYSDKNKYKVYNDKNGCYEELYYSSMSDNQKSNAINSIMSKNSELSKIYILTYNNKFKYYANESTYNYLKKLGIRNNIYKETNKLKGFI